MIKIYKIKIKDFQHSTVMKINFNKEKKIRKLIKMESRLKISQNKK